MAHSSNSLSQAYRLKGHDAAVQCCAAAGSLIVSGAEDGRLLVHDLGNAPGATAETESGVGAGPAGGSKCASSNSASAASPASAVRPLLSLLLRGPKGQDAGVTAVAANPSCPEACVFAAAASAVHLVDLRAGSVVQTYDASSEEVNGLSVSPRGTHLAAGDDAGEVHIYDLTAGRQFKCIRNVHRSICSSVAFRAHKPWDLLSGGLDSTVAKYDFSRPKCVDRWDMNALASSVQGSGGGGGGQIFNPPFVHQIAVPPGDQRPACQWAAAARGDGSVVVLDADVSSAASGSSGPTSLVGTSRGGARGGGGGAGKGAAGGAQRSAMQPLVLDRDVGGHTRPVCSVAFAPLGAATAGAEASSCRLYSGGEDCRIVLWDVGAALAARAEGRPLVPPAKRLGGHSESAAAMPEQHEQATASGSDQGGGSNEAIAGTQRVGQRVGNAAGDDSAVSADTSGRTVVLADVLHPRKVNQLCAFHVAGQELVAVAAVSKFVTVYQLTAGVVI